jgi:hypothetical protein
MDSQKLFEQMDKSIKNLRQILLSNYESPRLTKEHAAKYLKIGKDKMLVLIKEKKIIKYVDEWGSVYFLKTNLDRYLESNTAEEFNRRLRAV